MHFWTLITMSASELQISKFLRPRRLISFSNLQFFMFRAATPELHKHVTKNILVVVEQLVANIPAPVKFLKHVWHIYLKSDRRTDDNARASATAP